MGSRGEPVVTARSLASFWLNDRDDGLRMVTYKDGKNSADRGLDPTSHSASVTVAKRFQPDTHDVSPT